LLYAEPLNATLTGPRNVTLEFSLPAGAYATQVIAEFTQNTQSNENPDA
jgi:tRNA(Glu) U13 pseudouridine synthase TruD